MNTPTTTTKRAFPHETPAQAIANRTEERRTSIRGHIVRSVGITMDLADMDILVMILRDADIPTHNPAHRHVLDEFIETAINTMNLV